MLEYDLGGVVDLQMFNQPNAGARVPQEPCQCDLPPLDRLPAQILAVELQKIKGVQDRDVIIGALPQHLEYCQPAVVADHRLAVDQK